MIVTVGIEKGKHLAPFGKGLGAFRDPPKDQASVKRLNNMVWRPLATV